MNLNDEIQASQDAKMVLDSPAYQKAWKEIREGIISAMNAAPMGDEKTHNKLVISLQIVNKLQKQLENALVTGKMAEIQLDEQSKFKRMLSKF